MNIEKTRAMMVGFALGDALGATFTGMSQLQINTRFGRGSLQLPPNSLQFSHVTEDMLATAAAVRWVASNPIMTFPRQVASSVIAGCVFQHQDGRLGVVRQSSDLESVHLAAALSVAYLVQLALDGAEPSTYLPRTLAFVDGISEVFDATLYRVGQSHFSSQEQGLRHIGKQQLHEEIVALALYCVLQYPDDYAQAVRLAATTDDHRSEVAAITGAVIAARSGKNVIPKSWQAGFDLQRIDEVAYKLTLQRDNSDETR